ncbi:MAG: ABC transporter substrate-binding protein [Hyphomicrobiales bacterium]|nr:ABC transporter substrate-binding protein [Hyphomicrobiales bacterium]
MVPRDKTLEPTPSLATSWKLIDDNTWEFKVRPGVKVHNGADVAAEDVTDPIERMPNAQGPTGRVMLSITGII